MKLSTLMLLVSALIFSSCASVNLAGQKYVGKPVKKAAKPGIEGMGTAGEIKFNDAGVTFVWPGSDEKDSGTYKATKETVTITDSAGKVHTLAVKDEGKVLVNGSEEFRRTDFPW